MIDVKGPVRKAYYELLNGNLSYNSINVPVSDSVEKLADTTNLYVLLSQQDGRSNNTHQSWHSEETILIDIVYRGTRINKDTIDSVANQIYTLLLPGPQWNALPSQVGVTIINLRMTDDRYLIFKTTGAVNVTRRLITFTQFVSPYAAGGLIPPSQGGGLGQASQTIFHYVSNDFIDSTSVSIPEMDGINIEVYWNETQRFLQKADGEWTDYPGGGFTVLIPGFDKNAAVYNFYVYVA